MVQPLVSCIMPTADRPDFIPRSIDAFLRQDYEPRELIILDDGDPKIGDHVPWDSRIHYGCVDQRLSVGMKRNIACERARGAVIAHWDDDDWYAPWRLSYQMEVFSCTPEVAVCGLARMLFYEPATSRAWQYAWTGDGRWVYGATLCYRRSVWERAPFANIREGEDTVFLRGVDAGTILPLERTDFYVGIIHPRNTSVKQTMTAGWTPCHPDVVAQVMGADWPDYRASRSASSSA